VTADHGEAFYEHQHQGHGQSVYEEEVRVPLLMLQPGVVPRRIVDEPVQLVDVMPTILTHCSIPFGAGVLQGRDLFGDSARQSRPVFVSRYFYPDGEAAALRSDEYNGVIETPWKLIETRRGDASHPQLELYNLDSDSGERSNLASRMPDVVARLSDRLSGFLRRQEKEKQDFRSVHGIQRAARSLMPQDALDRLRSLGYLK
jgi:arylsulfatase A-like enzyme